MSDHHRPARETSFEWRFPSGFKVLLVGLKILCRLEALIIELSKKVNVSRFNLENVIFLLSCG